MSARFQHLTAAVALAFPGRVYLHQIPLKPTPCPGGHLVVQTAIWCPDSVVDLSDKSLWVTGTSQVWFQSIAIKWAIIFFVGVMPSVCKKHTCEVHKTRCACPPFTFDCVTLGVTGAEPLPENQTDITSGEGVGSSALRTSAWNMKSQCGNHGRWGLCSASPVGGSCSPLRGMLESILPTYFWGTCSYTVVSCVLVFIKMQVLLTSE